MPELPLVGADFAGYRLRSVLGRGGMSIVYQAENPRLRNVIALKVLAPELANDQAFRSRFREESQIAASLNHPNVIPIHDFGSSDGLLYIAMRYVSGTDLRQLIADHGYLTPDAAVFLLDQAARALDAAHRRGLVHRDVKPGNLLVARSGSGDVMDPEHVYLADFGITKHVGMRTELTAAGTILGTLHYMSPEQIQEQTVLGTADQYSLGCVLYECLTGHAPFERSSNEALMWAHMHEFPARPSLLQPELPRAVDEVFSRVLAKHPDDRYTNCREFIALARDALQTAAVRPQDRWTSSFGALSFGAQSFGAQGFRAPSFGAQSFGAQSFGAPGLGAQGAGAQGFEAVGEFQSAPVASGGPRDLGRAPVMQPREPTASVSAPAWAFGPGDARWAAAPARGGNRLRRGWFSSGRFSSGRFSSGQLPEGPSLRTTLSLLGIAAVAAAGTVFGMVASQGDKPSIAINQAAESTPPSALFATLDNTEAFTGMLPMSTCVQQATTRVQCANPTRAIASVTFKTFPSLAALYSDYQEIVDNLSGGQSLSTVENAHPCSAVAPDPTGESSWNHSNQYSTHYSVAQLASGQVPTSTAMGRVFCAQKADGSAVMVWTENAGDMLGYATGGDASHEQVWNWFYAIHHNIIFPGQPGMAGMATPPTARGTAARGTGSATPAAP